MNELTTRRSSGGVVLRMQLREEYNKQQDDIRSLENDLRNLTRAQEKFEAEWQQLQAEDVKLSPAHLEEYNRRKEQAGAETSEFRQNLERVKRQQMMDQDTLVTLQGREREYQARKRQLEDLIAQLTERGRKLEEFVNATHARQEELRKQRSEIAEANREAQRRQAELTQRLQELHDQLREMKADRKENERETHFREVLESLKRLFPGVLGRVSDLVSPIHRRFNVAVTVALGKHMDAVIVQDEKTALDCVQYMREQRAGIATFLPLDTLRVKPIDERLRTEHKLVIDVLRYDAAIEKVRSSYYRDVSISSL